MKTQLIKLLQPSFNENSAGVTIVKKNLLEKYYQNLVSENKICYDHAQLRTVQKLQIVLDQLTTQTAHQKRTVWQKLIAPPSVSCKSLYLYGGVGCGKSMLMDLFFEQCPLPQKRRVHFHAFMQEVHQMLHQLRQSNSDNLIAHTAQQIRQRYQLLCFDEFHVTDIADAMILGRLFSELFQLGVVLVATSNRHPDDLYHGGLQRELFLPFIDLLKQTADIEHLVTGKDYRVNNRHISDTSYHYPLNEEAHFSMQFHFAELSDNAVKRPGSLRVAGRDVGFSVVHKNILMASFAELCKRPLAAADYLAIAERFDTVLIADIPQFLPQHRNEAKRFVTLIDILYEHKIKLICTAAVKAIELYPEGDGAFEFARTVSRLLEMQSERYLLETS